MPLFDVGCELLRRGLTVAEGRGVRLLGISVSGIQVEGHLQLELPLPDDSRGVRRAGSPQDRLRTELDANVDRLREKYGKDVIGNASVLLGPDGGRDGLSELITRRR